MKSFLGLLGVGGGLCFLTMGVPVLLAVGLAGFLSAYVWLPLAAAIGGIAGLAGIYSMRRRHCQVCASNGQTAGLWRHIAHSMGRG